MCVCLAVQVFITNIFNLSGSLVKVQPVEQSPCSALYNSVGASPEEAMKLIRGLGHLPDRDRLGKLGVHPGEGCVQTSKHLSESEETCKEAGEELSMRE